MRIQTIYAKATCKLFMGGLVYIKLEECVQATPIFRTVEKQSTAHKEFRSSRPLTPRLLCIWNGRLQ